MPSTASTNTAIGAGDLLEVRVLNMPELSGTYRVSEDGQLDLPLIGKLPIAGLDTSTVAGQIADQYRARGFLIKPQITVRVLEFTKQGITVEGSVRSPGIYPMYAPRPLVDALALSGGLTAEADTRVQVDHRLSHTQDLVELPVEGLRSSSSQNILVYPGDHIFVPKAGIIYVLGGVVRPGGIVMRSNGHLTLLQALSEAQGTLHTASVQNSFVLRKQGASYTRVAVPLKPYIKGEQGDLELQAGDIFVVPISPTKLFFQESSAILASLGGASLYAVAATR